MTTCAGDDSLQPGLTLHRFHADVHEGDAVIDLVVDAPSFDPILRLQEELRDLQNQGCIKESHLWQLFPGQRMLIAGRADKRQRNPYTEPG